MKEKNKIVHWFVIGTFVLLYLLVSIISTIHVIDFFGLSNSQPMAITLAIAFELGAAASLAALVVLKKLNQTLVYGLFIVLTAMQAMGNTYYAYTNLEQFQDWIELFGLMDYDLIVQKRILAIVSGAILPLVALGFIKSLVDYIKPEDEEEDFEDIEWPESEEDLPEPNEALKEVTKEYQEKFDVNNPIIMKQEVVDSINENLPDMVIPKPVSDEELVDPADVVGEQNDYIEIDLSEPNKDEIESIVENEPDIPTDTEKVIDQEPEMVKKNQYKPQPTEQPKKRRSFRDLFVFK